MIEKLKKMMSKCALALPRQSGVSAAMLLVAIAGGVAPTAQAGAVNWAHQAAGFTNNGQVTIKTLSGGSYAGTLNPTGAVAKANQSAATQPPTVVIQATGGLYGETMPILIAGTVPATCPTGYTAIFSQVGVGSAGGNNAKWNIGGTRWSLTSVVAPSGGTATAAWIADNSPLSLTSNGNYAASGPYTTSTQWAAALCTK